MMGGVGGRPHRRHAQAQARCLLPSDQVDPTLLTMDELPPPAYDAPRDGRPRRLPSIMRGPRAPPSRGQAPTPGSSHSHDGDLSSTASSCSVSESASSEKERLASYYIANEGPVLESETASSHIVPPSHTDTTFQPLRPRRRGLATIPEPSTVGLTRGLTLPPAYPPPNLISPITPRAPAVPGYTPSASPAPSSLHTPPPSSPSTDRRFQPAPPQPRRSLYEDPSDQSWSAPASSLSLPAMSNTPRISNAHQFYKYDLDLHI
jgi:hypothetical protein